MNVMIQLNVVALICTRRSNGKPRARKMQTLRGLLLLLAVEGRSERCGASATAKPKKNGEVFRRHTFPPFWLMNSKLTKLAAAAGPRV
jgi:hypothetical protein